MTTTAMKRKSNSTGECPFGGKKAKTEKGVKSGGDGKKVKKAKKKEVVHAGGPGENGNERKVKKAKVAKDKGGTQKEENGFAGGDVPTNKLVENFRQKLNQGSVAIDVIRHFTQSIQQNPSYAVDFIRAGGTFKPLLKILAGLDKEKLPDIADLFQLIHYILLESVNYDETHADYAAKCAKTLLAEYKPSIMALLKGRNEQLLMGGFRILKAILVVDPAAHGKEILGLLDICLPEMEIGKCRENAGDGLESLRGVFVDFNLCFLIETGSELVRAWLSRFQLLSPLVGNLIWDRAENVILVMKTLEKYVLGSSEIDKYIYRTTFSTDILKALVNVYEWVGPDKKGVDEQVRNTVMNATEKVVLPLLTSRKYHLVPKVTDLGKVNSRHKHILLALKNSQLHKHQRKLVLKMFDVCPEVLPVVLENFGSLLKTKNLENRQFVLEIIRQPNPVEVTKHFTSADAKQVSNFVTKTTLPKTILEFVTTSIEKKIATGFCMEFLAVMLSQCEKYLQEVPKLKNLDQFDLKKVKFDVINQILGMFPSIDAIMAAMINHRSDKSVSKPYIAMEHVMDILLHCIRAFPAYIESSSFITAYRNILDPVYKSRALEHEYLPYEFKAIKVVIALEPQSIAFNSDLFPSVLKLLTKVYLNGDPPMQREATNLLIALFQNTTLFGNNATEIEVWFQSLLAVEPRIVPELVSYLAFSFARAAERQNLPAAKDHTLVNEAFEKVRRTDLDELFRRVEEEAEGQVDLQDEPQELPVADNFLIYMFHPATKKPAQYHPYLEAVALRYFHLLPHPEIVEHCAKSVEGKFGSYFTEWIVEGKTPSLEECGETTFLGRLSSQLLSKEQNVKKVVTEDLTRCDLVYLIHEVIFYASRLIELDQFDATYSSTCLFYLNHFFDLLIAAEVDIPESDQKLGEVVRHIFCHRPALFQRFTIAKQSKSGSPASIVTAFVYELMKKLQSTADFAQHTVLYSNKIVNEIISSSVESSSDSAELDAMLVAKLLEIFQLNERHCVNLLRHYSKLSHRRFIDAKNERTYHYNLLTTGLNKLATNPDHFLEAETVRGLSKIYVDFIRENGNELNLEALETALQAYLGTFSHNVGHLEEDLFRCFFESKRIGKPMVKLAAFLLARDSRLEAAFLELIPGNVSKKELIYPLMNVAFQKGVFKEDSEEHKKLLGTVYNEFKSGLNKTIEKPGKAAVIYKENTIANQQLLQRCMPKNECVDFAKKKLKLDSIEVYQLKLMMEIYRKAFESCKEDATQLRVVYSNVFNVLLQFFNILLKVNDLLKEVEKLNEIVLATFSWVKLHLNCKELHGLEFKEIIETSNWTNFCKLALKTGIDTQKSPENPSRLDERLHILLKITAILVDLFYADNSSPAEIATLYELALSHSRFLDVILVPFQFKVKKSLVHLLLILARKNHSVMDKKHIPILLGSYGATLTETNRFILALIQHYERSGVHIHEFRPFLWGDAAIKHFSLGQDSANQQTLFRTNNAEVFALLNREKMINTLQSFPVWRKLNANWQLPEVNFDELKNGSSVGRYPAASEIERFVEDKKQRVPPRLLEHCAGKKEVLAAIYDPAFLLPMLGYLFAPEATDVLDLAGKVGAFALPFACLASTDEHMRLAAASVIVRIKGHLELSRKFIDSKFWLHMFTAVQNGLAALRGNKRPADSETVKLKIPKPAFLSSLFIAETVNVLSDVLNELHSTLTRYFMLKDTFDFRAVPNFLVMFHSSEVKHNTHRHFILETIYNGLKTHEDFMVLRTSPVIRALLEFYGSTLSNRDLNILILNTLNSIVKIPKSCEVMLNSLGFLTWLSERIEHVESFHFETIEAFLGIISNAWYSAVIQRKEFNMKQLSRSVLIMLLKLLPLFSTRSSSKTLSRFLNLLEKTTKENPANIALINKEVLDMMLEYFAKLFEEQFWHVRYVLLNGSANAEDCQSLGEKLLASGMDESTAYIVLTLRRFVIRWQAAQQQQQGVVSK
ncbi:uncharacterized protein LOC6038101 [Culex quinquefasciatus]|uniref:uncharacterized protein LOC6038101 n=1 Tax=Culex quinquefasciatus TaxID=7176 RepID=UPI0018E3CC69|nr:uncharacterized protein LOC6038101 [Culex quinquefasciatus]